MFKLGFVLALYATAACVGLAFVYSGTETIIALRQQADLEASLKELFPQGDAFEPGPAMCGTSSNPALIFNSYYLISREGAVIGMAVRASINSYGGPLSALVGIDIDQKITRVKILSHSDTPGLGANAASSSYFVDRSTKTTFTGQFAGKSAGDSFAVKDDIIAITASTITSRAVSALVKECAARALEYFAAQ
ncbi:MAG: FMN-binding protein [Spirochaetaceae bacterium]|jgi:electron transport complex protein RnfG|nr:FMN-binding protein [Spirochaetaceae bacterium]